MCVIAAHVIDPGGPTPCCGEASRWPLQVELGTPQPTPEKWRLLCSPTRPSSRSPLRQLPKQVSRPPGSRGSQRQEPPLHLNHDSPEPPPKLWNRPSTLTRPTLRTHFPEGVFSTWTYEAPPPSMADLKPTECVRNWEEMWGEVPHR